MIGLTAVAATPTVLTVIKVTNLWILGGAATGAAVLLVLASFWQDRYKRIISSQDEVAKKLKDGCLTLASGKLPKVRQITNPITLGVHPSIPLTNARESKSRVPPYISRDIDRELCSRILEGGFVLIVGDSTAGKSRAAFEVMRGAIPNHTLIAPHSIEALQAAVQHALRCRNAVLWLNDLERYLRQGGLSKENIAALISAKSLSHVVLATVRSVEQARLLDEHIDSDAPGGRDGREVREVLALAHQVRLFKRFSSEEIARAKGLIADQRIAMALEYRSEFGIAEYLAAAPELARAYENAWDIGANPRGAALVSSAIDCRRAGFLSPIPRALLEQLHEGCLSKAGGQRLNPESLEEAWQWATRPRQATAALLSIVSTRQDVAVFDYLVDMKQSAQEGQWYATETFINTSLTYASASDSLALGEHAYWGDHHLASQKAFRRALALYEKVGDLKGQAHALKGLGNISHSAKKYDHAVRMFQRAWQLYEAAGDSNGRAEAARGLCAVTACGDEWQRTTETYINIKDLLLSIEDRFGCLYIWNGVTDLLAHGDEDGPYAELYAVGAIVQEEIQTWFTKQEEEVCANHRRSDLKARVYAQVYDLYEVIEDWTGQAYVNNALGDIALEEAGWSTAAQHYEDSWTFYKKSATELLATDKEIVGRSRLARSCKEYNRIASDYHKTEDPLDIEDWRRTEEQIQVLRKLSQAAANLRYAIDNVRVASKGIEATLVDESIRRLGSSISKMQARLLAESNGTDLLERLRRIELDIEASSLSSVLSQSFDGECDGDGL
ncbi:tetratricopeptide repeat protein [Sphaerisporangium sp. NBC_01403]|uniref:tetratricopeptide repeat protein n=1 Tax=Sphaerisporangium sp. NBC_01403 TaxID=2903599 RepID=UPI0032553492